MSTLLGTLSDAQRNQLEARCNVIGDISNTAKFPLAAQNFCHSYLTVAWGAGQALPAAAAGSNNGFLNMQLLAHTLPEDTEFLDGMVGCFAVEDDPDPLMELWFEAGPHRLTIVRDGRPVHVGGVR